MVTTPAIVYQAVKFGYKRYGVRGAVAAGVAVGASYVVIKKIVPRYAPVDRSRVNTIVERIKQGESPSNVLGDEFVDKFGDYADLESDDVSSSQ